MNARRPPLLPLLSVLGSVTFLALGTSWAKHTLFPLVGAEGTSALRVGFSALLLLLVWRPWRWTLRRGDALRIACYGAALGAMNLCFYMALRSIPFGIAVAIEFSGPLTVALLGSRRPIDFLWIVLAAAGLGVLLPGVHSASTLDALGLTYALAAAVLWATYIVAGKRLGHLHAGHSVSLGLTVAAIVVVPIGLAHAGAAVMSPTVLLVGVCVAALSSAIPISLEMVALKRLPKQAFGVMLSMEPAMAALLGLALLDERLSAMQWLAIGAIMAASMGTAFTAQRPAAPPAVSLQGGS